VINYTSVATWSQAGSAVLFLAVLAAMWVKYIAPSVVTAQRAANERIAEAERHRDEVRSSLAVLQEEVAAAQRDAASISARAHAQARTECERIIDDAREAGNRAVAAAKGELDRARAAARIRLRDELLSRAVSLARVRARERVDDAVNRKLVGTFVHSLEQRHHG
jgi:F0F1-type ATP synthase membrane subunit b/b'